MHFIVRTKFFICVSLIAIGAIVYLPRPTEWLPVTLRIIGSAIVNQRNQHVIKPWYESDISYLYLNDLSKKQSSDLSNATQNFTRQHSAFYREAALRHFFAPKLSPDEKKILISTLRSCLKIVEDVGLDYMLYSGSLIGYYRHNGSIIPWDDDIDIALFPKMVKDIPQLVAEMANRVKELATASKDLELVYVERQRRFKCFYNNNQTLPIKNYKWRFPFVDLQFMITRIQRNNTRFFRRGGSEQGLITVEDATVSAFKYPKNMIFPLQVGYFTKEKIPVFLPNDIESVLSNNFNISECRSPAYSHSLEDYENYVVSVACSELRHFITDFTNI